MAGSADCILVQDTVSTGVPAALVARLLGKKLIVRVPGDYAWEQGTQQFGVKDSLDDFQNRSYGLRVALLRTMQRFTVNSAMRIIAPSNYLARIVKGWLKSGRPIDVIYNGVEFVHIRPAHGEDKKVDDLNLIVTSGRLVPWKGIGELIDIVARSSWKLIILGDGPEREKMERKIKSLKAEGKVQLLGQVLHTDAQMWFARAAVFVLNSRYEGLSHTLIEAMAAGAPVVATNVGGNPEVIEDDVNGLLCEVGNVAALERSLTLLMQDVSLRERLGKAAQDRARSFSIDTCVEKTTELLKSL
jgi:glycosyltransferase involved in cell wall biosynthesis